MKRKISCVFMLLWFLVATADAKVSPSVLHNHLGEIMVDYLDFVEEFGRVFKGKNLGGEKRHYALLFIGDNAKESVEVCFRHINGTPAPFENPASVISTICEIKLPFKDREEMKKAVRYANRITSAILLIYEKYQEAPSMGFQPLLPKRGRR